MRVAMLLHKSVEFDSRVRREARALAEAGHAVTVVELAVGAHGSLDGFARVSAAPAPWVRRALPFQAYRGVFLASFLCRLVQLRPEIVHAHDAAMLLPGLLGARMSRAKLVYDSHELATGVPYRDGAWAHFVSGIERLAVPRAAAVITVTEGIADRMQELYSLSERPSVVRNVTELVPPRYPTGALRDRLGIGKAALVLHQGAPAPDRGGEQLIAAMSQVPGAHLAFLGTSPFSGYQDVLRAQATAAGVSARVHFLPSVPLTQLLELTADADVGVSLLQDTCENHRLALPNKLFEYIAAGVPVIASDLPEIARIIADHRVGWTVDPSDSSDLAQAVERAVGQRGDAQMRRRLATAATHLSWTAEQSRLLDVYRALGTQDRPRDRAMVLVRNSVLHDSRVRREVETLSSSGWSPVVVGVTAQAGQRRRDRVGAAPLIRLTPRSPLSRVRGARRRQPRGGRVTGPTGPPGPLPSSGPVVGAVAALHRVLTTLDFYRQAIALVRTHRPALVHCNDWNTMWIGVAAKMLGGVAVIYDAHELWADRNGRPEPRWWLIACEALFTRVADEVITTSPGYADVIARRYRTGAPTVVRNIPMRLDAATRSESSKKPTLAYVGGLVRGRGLEQAIAALAELPDAELLLIGPANATYRARLSNLALEAGVAERVQFRGPVPPDRVVSELAGAHIGLCLIQPICRSYELTLPNKLFEYVAAGVPMISSDLPVIAALTREHDLGEVAPPDDVSAIAAAARRLLEPRRQAECRANAAAFAERATWADERQTLARVYRAAQARNGGNLPTR